MPADEPALEPLPDLTGRLGRTGTIVTSPARRCRLPGVPVDDRLRAWDLGCWSGRPLEALDLATWRNDPHYDGHGGESLVALSVRVGRLLDAWHDEPGRVVAVTHAAVIKAMVVLALRAPVEAAWDVDVAPGSETELHATASGWRVVRVNCQVLPSTGTRQASSTRGTMA